MDCPHCRAEVTATPHTFALGIDQDGTWQVTSVRCPTCDRLIASVGTKEGKTYPAWPASPHWARLSADVPQELADEYLVASQVLPYSEEASAAISRRLLHRVLASQAGAGQGGLADQIDRALDSPSMPDYLKEALATLVKVAGLEPDSVKNYRHDSLAGAADGEAEWLLDVNRHFLDFYFVQPARMRRKRYAIEERLAPPAPPAEPEADERQEGAWVPVTEDAAAGVAVAEDVMTGEVVTEEGATEGATDES